MRFSIKSRPKPGWLSNGNRSGPAAASHGDIGVVDDQTVVVRAVKAVVDRDAELFGEVILLLGGRIHHSISRRNLEFPRNEIFSHLDVPSPRLAKIHGRAQELRSGDRAEIKRHGSTVGILTR